MILFSSEDFVAVDVRTIQHITDLTITTTYVSPDYIHLDLRELPNLINVSIYGSDQQVQISIGESVQNLKSLSIPGHIVILGSHNIPTLESLTVSGYIEEPFHISFPISFIKFLFNR